MHVHMYALVGKVWMCHQNFATCVCIFANHH